MGEITHRTVHTNGVDLHVAGAGPEDGKLVVLCHGFPELWYSWRHQLRALADAGYRVIAPDQRGYGQSSRPDAVEDYDIVHLTDDVIGLIDDAGRDTAVVVGHDWGAPVVWNLAQRAPERVEAVVGMSVPFSPRGPRSVTDSLSFLMGDRFFYILWFQKPGVADADLGKDPRETLRRFYGAISGGGGENLFTNLPMEGTTFYDWMGPVEKLPGWLTDDDFEVFVTEFERTGFTGGINWYRNFHRNWEISPEWGDRKVEMPALFIAGSDDPVIRMARPEGMEGWVTDLRGSIILPGIGHWVQQEAPAEVNAALLDFLAGLGR